jgi:hypothetical protein
VSKDKRKLQGNAEGEETMQNEQRRMCGKQKRERGERVENMKPEASSFLVGPSKIVVGGADPERRRESVDCVGVIDVIPSSGGGNFRQVVRETKRKEKKEVVKKTMHLKRVGTKVAQRAY